MTDERPSDAMQPAAKKRAGAGGLDRDNLDDDGPSYNPGTWTADAAATNRERRKVHVRRHAGAPGEAPAAAAAPAPANPFAGIGLAGAAAGAPAPAAANPFAAVRLTPAAETPQSAASAGATPVGEQQQPAAADAAGEGGPGQGDGTGAAKPSEQGEQEAEKAAKPAEAEPAPAGGLTTTGSGATATVPSPFGGAGTAGGFAGLASSSGTGVAGSFSFGSAAGFSGFGGAAAGGGFGGFGGVAASAGTGAAGGFGSAGSIFGAGGSTTGGFGSFTFAPASGKTLFGASAGAGSPGAKGAGEGAAGEEGDERPDSFEPVDDPSVRPVVQLAAVPKVTGEEQEQAIFTEAGKLFEYDSAAGKWRERGAGEFKVNVSADGASSRLVMRQAGNLRLLLNARVTSGMAVQRMNGAKGVSFGCVNTAAPVEPQPAAAGAADAKDSKEQEEAADGKEAKEGGGAVAGDKEAKEGSKTPQGLMRTWALRMKAEDRVLALVAALERAKAQHAAAHADDHKGLGETKE